MPSPTERPVETEIREYQPPRKHFRGYIFGLVFFSLLLVGSVWSTLANQSGIFEQPHLVAGVYGCFWGGWVLSCGYKLVECRRARLSVSETTVQVIGVFRTHMLRFNEVTRAEWRAHPAGGGLALHGPVGRVVINFANYADGPDLAHFLRNTLPLDKQHHFDRFEGANIPGSKAYTVRKTGDRRVTATVMGMLGLTLIMMSIWNPCRDVRLQWYGFLMGSISIIASAKEAMALRKSARSQHSASDTSPD